MNESRHPAAPQPPHATLSTPAALALVLLSLLFSLVAAPAPAAAPALAADEPTAAVSPREGGVGGEITVTGRGWRPGALITVLVCGQNGIGGTRTCANATGRATEADQDGGVRLKLPVAEPPKPCPCVVRVTSVTGADPTTVDVPFVVAGHPVADLPEEPPARLSALDVRLDGSGGLLEWFGAPPDRTVVVTLGNLGSSPVKDPVFRIGTAHSVFAPEWQDVRWNGTLPPGGRREVRLPVELSSGAHGAYTVSVEHDGELLAEQPWSVPRPWGVPLFWGLMGVVIPAALFRIGLLIVNRLRPVLATAGQPDTAPVSGSTKGSP